MTKLQEWLLGAAVGVLIWLGLIKGYVPTFGLVPYIHLQILPIYKNVELGI